MLKRDQRRPMSPNAIVRLAALAGELGISRETLYRWERGGLIPPRRQLGPATRGWLRSDIEAWLASRETTVPSDAA